MRVLVFEQWQGGHYFNYLECLVPRLASAVEEVVVSITEAAHKSQRFAEQLRPLEKIRNVRFDTSVPIPVYRSAVQYRLALGSHLVDAVRRHSPDYVFLPSGDEQTLPLPILALQPAAMRVPVEAILHYNAYLGRDSVRESVVSGIERALLRTGAFAQLNFVNFLHYEDAKARGLNLRRFSRAAGDPVPQPPKLDRYESRAALGLDGPGRIVGMVGALDERKAVLQTVRAFALAKLPSEDRLLLAGRLHSSYRPVIDRDYAGLIRSGRLILMDRFLSDLELQQSNAAVDLNCSIYVNFYGLSSLMLKSIAADVPIVTNRRGWGGAVAQRFEVGSTIDPQDVEAYAQLLPKALDASIDYRRSNAVERLMQFHSMDNFAAGVTERCLRLAGKEPEPAVDWAWVMASVPLARRHFR